MYLVLQNLLNKETRLFSGDVRGQLVIRREIPAAECGVSRALAPVTWILGRKASRPMVQAAVREPHQQNGVPRRG